MKITNKIVFGKFEGNIFTENGFLRFEEFTSIKDLLDSRFVFDSNAAKLIQSIQIIDDFSKEICLMKFLKKGINWVADDLNKSDGEWCDKCDIENNQLHIHCPKCDSSPKEHHVENHDMMWHDGDVVCDKCGTRVRGYDAG